MTSYLNSNLSQVYHYFAFSYNKPITEFDTASFITSIDVDVGNPEIERNREGIERRVHSFLAPHVVGRIEEQVVPLLLQAFDEVELPVTFALRGQLTEVENSIIGLMLESSNRHDIAAHGYTHKVFTALSEVEAEQELSMISVGMKKFGIVPKSFVFPKNEVSHLPLLEKYGYLSFRGRGGFLRDGMYVKKCGNMFDIHPSLYLRGFYDFRFLRKIINFAARQKRPLHLWFHPWNLGSSSDAASKRIAKVLVPLIEYAKEKKRRGLLQFETMRSIAEKCENK